ncbi:MAG: hypothetical protein WAU39_11220 [Polyangiales bacterium]
MTIVVWPPAWTCLIWFSIGSGAVHGAIMAVQWRELIEPPRNGCEIATVTPREVSEGRLTCAV